MDIFKYRGYTDLDVVDEGDVVALNGFPGPDERRVRLGFVLLALLHATHGLPAVQHSGQPSSPFIHREDIQ